MSTQLKAAPLLPPVVKSLVVARSQADAFRIYTDEISMWWPKHKFSIGAENVASVALEGRVGGRIFERWHDGSEKLWGTVIAWEPPARLVYTWHVATDPEHTSEVELRFAALGANRTRVTLEHRHWERMSGERAAAVRENYDNGWQVVLYEFFGGHAGKIEGETS
jgi:uncharacterized protein YndB with AHSA1/START domain